MGFPASSPSSHAKGSLFLVMASILWGTTGTAQALAPPGAQPLSVGAARLFLGAAVLFLFAWGRDSFRGWGPWPKGWALAAAAGIGAYQALFFFGVAAVGVAVGTVVTLGTSTVFAGLLTLWFDRTPLGPRWMWGTLLGVAGLALLAAWPGGGKALHPWGVVPAAGAGFAYAGMTVANKRLLAHLKPDAAMALVFLLAVVLFLPLLPFLDFRWMAKPTGLAVGTHLGLVTIGLAYFFYARGLAGIAPATAVTLSLAEPTTAAILGFTLLGERLTPVACAGLVLIFFGLLLAAAPAPVVEIQAEPVKNS